jgi:hypothetical protein
VATAEAELAETAARLLIAVALLDSGYPFLRQALARVSYFIHQSTSIVFSRLSGAAAEAPVGSTTKKCSLPGSPSMIWRAPVGQAATQLGSPPQRSQLA